MEGYTSEWWLPHRQVTIYMHWWDQQEWMHRCKMLWACLLWRSNGAEKCLCTWRQVLPHGCSFCGWIDHCRHFWCQVWLHWVPWICPGTCCTSYAKLLSLSEGWLPPASTNESLSWQPLCPCAWQLPDSFLPCLSKQLVAWSSTFQHILPILTQLGSHLLHICQFTSLLDPAPSHPYLRLLVKAYLCQNGCALQQELDAIAALLEACSCNTWTCSRLVQGFRLYSIIQQSQQIKLVNLVQFCSPISESIMWIEQEGRPRSM